MTFLVPESSGIIESSLTPVAPTIALTPRSDPHTATATIAQQPSSSTATLATGIPTVFHAMTSHRTWVLASEANDHMTGKLSVCSSPVLIHQTVYVADGSTSTIQHKDDVCLSPNITLLFVVHDWISKKIFSRGYERDGLYYFGDPPSKNVLTSSLQASVLPNPQLCVFFL
ncbi:hypothetical protein Acr_00g0057130 [Actinidia rufa]|uniref:Uncharacterized protein n=1 Tax=Actinidia rufa TaxID=165716 RepID=A0A7J0DPH0_9ERIC|nr:hypothetical protein Acr_00g0057130 [Actinidia rufa]